MKRSERIKLLADSIIYELLSAEEESNLIDVKEKIDSSYQGILRERFSDRIANKNPLSMIFILLRSMMFAVKAQNDLASLFPAAIDIAEKKMNILEKLSGSDIEKERDRILSAKMLIDGAVRAIANDYFLEKGF
jgi:hypothetical protein